MAEITFVKGETSALDRTWMSMPDGSTRQLAVHVIHDLPHLPAPAVPWHEIGAGQASGGCGARGGER